MRHPDVPPTARSRRDAAVVIAATALLLPLVVTGGGAMSMASADPSRLAGVVSLPGGPGAAAVIDVTAMSGPGGAPVKAFARAVADADGRFALRIPARPSLRLLARRTGGLHLNVDVTDLMPMGSGVVPEAYVRTFTGSATFTRNTPAHFTEVPDARRRAAATLTTTTLAALAAVNPDGVLAAVGSRPASLTADPLAVVAESVVAATFGSPPSADGFLAYARDVADPALRAILAAVTRDDAVLLTEQATGLRDALVDLSAYARDGDPATADLAALMAEPGAALDAVYGLPGLIADGIPGYADYVQEAVATVKQAVSDALAADARADGTTAGIRLSREADALTALVLDTATRILANPPDLQHVLDNALAGVDESIGSAIDTGVVVQDTLRDALVSVAPQYASVVEAAARVKNYDPDALLGNDTIDDPDLVAPLGATIDFVPVPVDADELVDVGPTNALSDSSESGGDDNTTTNGCTMKKTRVVPGKDSQGNNKPQPVVGAAMRVVLKLWVCKRDDADPDNDYWAWTWDGKITNVDTSRARYWIWRFKFRTQLNTVYERDDEDPERDIKVDGEYKVEWNLVIPVGPASATIKGDYVVRQAKKIHPWSDYDGVLYHVSWMSNRDVGSRDDDFRNGDGNSFLVPQGDGSVSIKANNQIAVWKCALPYGNTGGFECDPR